MSNTENYVAEEWWEALDEAIQDGSAPEELETLASDETTEVSRKRLKVVLEFAESLPGWDGGPDHAPHPFTVVDD